MSTRQYIGARYVPKFMGNYDTTTAYEALSVVDNGAGTTYIAKVPTPPNTPLNNSTYWAVYGASSGAIVDLQTRMGNVENDILNQYTLNERKYVLIGDSYGTTYGGVTGWKDQFVSMLDLSSDDYVAEVANGYGFYAGFEDLLDSLSSDNDVTDVIIIGGTNDIQYVSTDLAGLKTRIASCVDKAKTKFPYARVHVGWCSSVFIDGPITFNDLPVCRKTIEDVSAYHGASVIPHLDDILCDWSLHLNVDHPNTDGCMKIAEQLITHLNGGTLSGFIPEKKITFDFTDESAGCDSCSDIYYEVCGDTIFLRGAADSTMRMSKFVMKAAQVRSRALDGTDGVSVAPMTNVPICKYTHRFAWVPCVMKKSDDTLIYGFAALYMYSGYLTIGCFSYSNGAAVTATIKEIYMNINLSIPRI